MVQQPQHNDRRGFLGGSDARIVMGRDEKALLQLWKEKRGDAEPEDLSGNLIVLFGTATEELNRSWYERNSGHRVVNVQRRVRHPLIPWMAATLDGIVEGVDAVFEAKFMLPWSFSEEAAVTKYMPQLQHNMWVTHLRTAVLSIITWAASGLRSRCRWTRSISAFWSRPKRSSGARAIRRASSPRQRRATAAAHRGGPDRRHECVEFVGGVRGFVLQHPQRPSRPRTCQVRVEGADAGGCQRGRRTRRARQALKIRCCRLRHS